MNAVSLALVFCFTVNTALSQVAMKQAMGAVGRVESLSAVPALMWAAAQNRWIHVSLVLQVLGYGMWLVVLSREKVGVAVSLSGAFFYLLVALAAWMLQGERLSATQWCGLALISCGVLLARD